MVDVILQCVEPPGDIIYVARTQSLCIYVQALHGALKTLVHQLIY